MSISDSTDKDGRAGSRTSLPDPATRAEFKRRRDYGLKQRQAARLKRWESVDSWLTRWEQAQDPNGKYGRVGRDPSSVIVNLEEAS
jgi:hypothetical protein